MLALVQEIFEIIGTSHDVIERVIGFRPIDIVAIIFTVTLINSILRIRVFFEAKHTIILSLICLFVSIVWAAISVHDMEGAAYAKAVFSSGFKLASVATLSYNIFKPVAKPAVNKFYAWLRSKGIEAPEVENDNER